MPPLVAIPGRRSPAAEGFRTPVVGAGVHYLDALDRAGAAPLLLHPGAGVGEQLPALLERVDGLLLLGGGDVDPARYGATDRHPEVYDVQPDQDEFELAALAAALDLGLPVLAVCRGAQLLNVARGGTLCQHISDDDAAVAHRGFLHDVQVEAGSRTAEMLGGTEATVYSRHHQAIDRVGSGLHVTAWAADGVVEAVELTDGWVVGLQWHPEDTAGTDPVQQSVFAAFVARCRP